MLTLLFTITLLVGVAFQNCAAAGSCQNANWWKSFDRAGWSKCHSSFPFINGLYRNKAARRSNDWIYLLEEAKCCNNGYSNAQCVQANWVASFDRNRNWNVCPSGYYLSGLFRSSGNNLHNIEHAWCCKPRGAPNNYKSCYIENVWSKFDWNRKGMVTCTRSDHYIAGLYRSICDKMYCIEEFKCCQLPPAPCSSSPCLNGGVCTNEQENFKCACRQGYNGDRCQNRVVALCHIANWWKSFDRTGWSRCHSSFPYINGLYRNKAARPGNDWIYLLEEAKCCSNGNSSAQCVQANWVASFDRNHNWNLCPTGYFLSGLYRSHGNNLHNIEYALCCKPRGAPNSYKSCYNENVWSRFDWKRKGMVTCTRAGYYITGLYRSSCNYMYCIEEFKCCQL